VNIKAILVLVKGNGETLQSTGFS